MVLLPDLWMYVHMGLICKSPPHRPRYYFTLTELPEASLSMCAYIKRDEGIVGARYRWLKASQRRHVCANRYSVVCLHWNW